MKTSELEGARERVRHAIEKQAFVRATERDIVSQSRVARDDGWLFDLRAFTLEPSIMNDVAALFWSDMNARSQFQIAGMETAGIPIVSSLVTYGYDRHSKDISGVYLRKSRKRDGLTATVEGRLREDRPVIIVDDLINTGSSILRQIEVFKAEGIPVQAVWTIIRFRDVDFYKKRLGPDIEIRSVFELNDFETTLGVKNLTERERPTTPILPLRIIWHFASDNPSYHHVVPKSEPALDSERVFLGSDNGTFWALNQSDGSIAWKHHTGHHPKGKGIFSSPVVHDGTVYFGAYDGNVYALDAATGASRWISSDADWIGSSPALAPSLGLLFIGHEYGLWRKRGGIAALDMDTGATRWVYRDMPCFTHASPLFIPETNEVAIGSNGGALYLFDAENGSLTWKAAFHALTDAEHNTGFSAHDIKGSLAYDAVRDLIVGATTGGKIFFVKRSTGDVARVLEIKFGTYSTPLVHDGYAYVTSLDKHLYAINLDTFDIVWTWNAEARIFASPALIKGRIVVGANTGRLTELDPATGRELAFAVFSERITNRAVCNPHTKRLFVPTFANELYCFERDDW